MVATINTTGISAKRSMDTANVGPAGSEMRDDKSVLHLPEQFYTSGQAARSLGIPARTMRRFLAVGRVKGEKNPITGTWQIARQELVRLAVENGFVVDREPESVRVLIVHHDEKLIHWLVGVLDTTLNKGKIEHTTDPCNALIRIGNQPPDVVFISPSMPILRGGEMLTSVRGFQETKHIKVVGWSSEKDSLREFRSLGADAILETPSTSSDVLQLLGLLVPGNALPKGG